MDNREEAPPTEPISIGGKLLYAEDQWLARQKEKREGGRLRHVQGQGSTSASTRWQEGQAQGRARWWRSGRQGRSHRWRTVMTPASTVTGLATGPRTAPKPRRERGGAVHMAEAEEDEEPALFLELEVEGRGG